MIRVPTLRLVANDKKPKFKWDVCQCEGDRSTFSDGSIVSAIHFVSHRSIVHAQHNIKSTMAIQRTTDQFEHPLMCREGLKRKASEMISPVAAAATDSSSSSPSEATCRKSLRFSEISTVTLLQPRSKEDRLNSWYSRKEITEFKRSQRALVEALQDTRTSKAMKLIAASIEHRSTPPVLHIRGKELIRGIEHVIDPELSRLIKRRRKRTIHGVLKAQSHLDHDRLAQSYRINSVFAKEWATLITNFQDA